MRRVGRPGSGLRGGVEGRAAAAGADGMAVAGGWEGGGGDICPFFFKEFVIHCMD
jgi:hypothetical protein